MTKTTYKKYVALIGRKVWTEQEIISFRKMLRASFTFGSTNASFDGRTNRLVAEELLSMFRAKAPYRITHEQSVKGLGWLNKACFTSKGAIRNSQARPFEHWDCQTLQAMLPKFSHWTFDDVHEVNNSYSGEVQGFAPVYTLHTRKKDEFCYVADPMGSARGCTVLYVSTKKAA